MVARLCMAMWPCLFLWSGVFPGLNQGPAHFPSRTKMVRPAAHRNGQVPDPPNTLAEKTGKPAGESAATPTPEITGDALPPRSEGDQRYLHEYLKKTQLVRHRTVGVTLGRSPGAYVQGTGQKGEPRPTIPGKETAPAGNRQGGHRQPSHAAAFALSIRFLAGTRRGPVVFLQPGKEYVMCPEL